MAEYSSSQSEEGDSDDFWVVEDRIVADRDGSSNDTVSRGRGRPLIQECWTRVIKPESDQEDR